MRKLLTFALLFISALAFGQNAPVNPIQLNQNTLYLEPSTGLRWGYNGASHGWYRIDTLNDIYTSNNFKGDGLSPATELDLADTIHTKFIHSDSAFTLRINSKKQWAPYYGVLNMAHNVGIRSDDNIHNLLLYNNLYAVGNTNNDWKYAENGLGSYLYLGINGSLTFTNALRGVAGNFATMNTRLMIDSLGHTFLPGLRDTTGTDTIVGYKNHQLYKIPFSAGATTLAANGLKKVGDTIIQAGNINRPTAISLDNLAGTGNIYFLGDTLNRAGIEVDINSGSVGAALAGKNADGSQTSNVFADAGEAQINAIGSLGSKSINLQADGDMTITDSQSKGLTNTGDYSNYIVNHDNALVTKKAAVRLIDSLGSGGGSGHNIYNHDGTQTDALRTDSLGANYLQFTGDDGTHTSTHTLGPDEAQFDIETSIAAAALQVSDVSSSLVNTTKSNGNTASVVTSSVNGGSIDIYYQKGATGSLQSGLFIDSTRMTISDPFNHTGLVGDELFTVSGDPKQYVQRGNLPSGGSDSTLYKTNGTLTEDRTVTGDGHVLNFDFGALQLSLDPANGFTSVYNTESNAYGLTQSQDGILLARSTTSGGHHYTGFSIDSLNNGVLLKDDNGGYGLRADSLTVDTTKMNTLNPWLYVTYGKVAGMIAAHGGGGSPTWGLITGTLSDQTDLQIALDAKQATLVSGTNIKSINSSSPLGSGNINLQTPLTAGTDYLGPSNFVYSEAPSGSINSSNVTYTLANTPVSGTVRLYQNGLRLKLTTDYTISSGTITMNTAPLTGDLLIADYRK